MAELTWQAYMATGLPEIDEIHQMLIRQMVDVEKTSAEEFCAAMQAMTALLEREFRAEEEQMEAIGHDDLASHREQHARALSGLHHMVSRAMGGDIAAGRHAVRLLQQWFVMHMTTQDRALAEALAAGGHARAWARPAPERHLVR